MNSFERVMTVMELGEPDRVPAIEWSINERIRKKLFAGDRLFDFEEQADLDGVVVYADYRKDWIDENRYRDEWGITLALTGEDYPVGVDFPIKEPDQLTLFSSPDPCAPWRFETLRAAVRQFKGRKAILFRLRDAYSLPRYLRGMENLMMDFIINPELVQALVDISIDYYTRMAYCAMEIGADVFWTSDDYCDNRGPIMGKEIWSRFLLPGLKRMVSFVTGEGYPFVKHCDGNILPLIDEMITAGVNCIDPIDTGSGMQLATIKADYGDRVAIKGGLPIDVLANGTVEEVEQVVRTCLQEGAAGGGYILSSSSDITAAVKPENFLRMLQANKRLGKYPLII